MNHREPARSWITGKAWVANVRLPPSKVSQKSLCRVDVDRMLHDILTSDPGLYLGLRD